VCLMVAETLGMHAHATRAEVAVTAEDGLLRVAVSDDGAGGAGPEGHGVVGVADRVTAISGWLRSRALPAAARS
jgi:signal transduction histidine kinase